MGESRKQSICYFDVEGCAVYGKNKLETAIKEAGYQVEVLNHFTEKKDLDGFVLVVGSVEDQRVEVLLKSTGTKPVREPQSTIRKWCKTVDGNILLLSGSDQVGLMYTLLEMAEQVRTEGWMRLLTRRIRQRFRRMKSGVWIDIFWDIWIMSGFCQKNFGVIILKDWPRQDLTVSV